MATEDKLLNGSGLAHLTGKIKDAIADKSEVSVSATGTATDEVGYITIDGVEKKIAGGGSGSSYTFTNGLTEDTDTHVVSWDLNSNISKNGTKYLNIAPVSLNQNANISIFGGIMDTMSDAGRNICIGDNNRIGWDGNSTSCLSFMTGGGTHRNSGSGNVSIGGSGKIDSNYTSAIGYGIKQTGNKRSNYTFKNIFGNFNIDDTTDQYQFIIGNGTADNARSNALTVDWSGNLVCNNIPAPPSSDGEYNLHCSIVNGQAIYSWVAAPSVATGQSF